MQGRHACRCNCAVPFLSPSLWLVPARPGPQWNPRDASQLNICNVDWFSHWLHRGESFDWAWCQGPIEMEENTSHPCNMKTVDKLPLGNLLVLSYTKTLLHPLALIFLPWHCAQLVFNFRSSFILSAGYFFYPPLTMFPGLLVVRRCQTCKLKCQAYWEKFLLIKPKLLCRSSKDLKIVSFSLSFSLSLTHIFRYIHKFFTGSLRAAFA